MGSTIGIDIGYGQTKTFTARGSKDFPTIVTSKVPEETFGRVRPILINDEKYLVGLDAVPFQNGSSYDLRSTDVAVIPQGAGIYFACPRPGEEGGNPEHRRRRYRSLHHRHGVLFGRSVYRKM